MREFLIALAAAVVIAVIGGFALNAMQRDAQVAYHSPTGVRI